MVILLLAMVVSLFTMWLVNSLSAAPTSEHVAEYCTRSCHNKGCVHFAEKYGYGKQNAMLPQIYAMNIKWLRDNPLGLSYYEMNLLIYVIIWPILVAMLIYGLARKRKA